MWRPLLTLSALVVSAPLLAIEVPQAPIWSSVAMRSRRLNQTC